MTGPGPGGAGLLAAVETGGTKVLCRVVTASGVVLMEHRFATTTAERALAEIKAGLEEASGGRPFAAIGLANFGPLVVNPASPDYGRMLATPKPGWAGANLRAGLAHAFACPVVVDTDVNAAALAEAREGAGRGVDAVAYVTIGTGIGGGLAIRGETLKGALHPEIGHLRLHRAAGDAGPSACPFHDDCAEGLAAGPAVALRLRGGETPADRPDVRALIAAYIAELCVELALAWAPRCIVFGGGVLNWPGLLETVEGALRSTRAYGPAALCAEAGFIRRAHFENAGLEGALMLARAAASSRTP